MSVSLLLSDLLPAWRAAPGCVVAFSGGLDSTVLLHALAQLARTERLPPLRAIHVHHGLQAAAEAWPEHCRRVCAELGVTLQVRTVRVEPGASLEQAARRARYAAFAEALAPAELLLTAQHRDDQAETLLFRLLRGAGVRGLAGMPACRPLGAGLLWRPLLAVSRAELRRYAEEHQLCWVEDPSNADLRFARNYLRQQVVPRLTERWPQALNTIARTAGHLAEAQGLLDELAELDLQALQAPPSLAWLAMPSLPLAPLLRLSAARQRNLLRHWLAPLTPLPDSEHWAGWDSLAHAAPDATPIWRLAHGQMHRADGRLWWLSGEWLQQPAALNATLLPNQWLLLPGNGRVMLRGEGAPEALQVRYRQGGECLQLAGRGRRDLKRWLNEQAVPAFVRGRLPLLYGGERLLAIANLAPAPEPSGSAWQFIWQPPTSDQGLS